MEEAGSAKEELDTYMTQAIERRYSAECRAVTVLYCLAATAAADGTRLPPGLRLEAWPSRTHFHYGDQPSTHFHRGV